MTVIILRMILLSLTTFVGLVALALLLSMLIGILAFVYEWSPLWALAPLIIVWLLLWLLHLFDMPIRRRHPDDGRADVAQGGDQEP